jgi:TP901 family phage tail tape measure protein
MPFSATRDLWLVLKARDEATRALRGFSRDIRLVGDSVRMANLQASRSAMLNQMAVGRLTGASQAQLLVTQRAIQANDAQIASMRIARAGAEEHRVAMQRLSSSMTGVASAAGAMGLALTATGFFGLRAMKGLINANVEYAKQAALTRTQVEGFVNSQKEIEDVGLRIARTIPVAFEQIQPALFDIFSSMDVGIQDAEKLLMAFSKAAVAGQTEITKAGRSTIGILNAFQLPISQVNHLLDLQFQLVQEGLGTYEEWAGRIGLVTPSAVRFGQSVEMMTAALAAATRMGIPAARSATAVSRAMDALSHPKSVKALQALGVNARDATGRFRPMIEIMEEFRAKLMKMPQAERIAQILDVFKGAGGTIEARRFLQNMLLTPGNLELFKTIFTEMSQTSGSFEQAYAMMADTTFAKSQILSNQWQALKVMAGEALAPAFLTLVGALSRVVEWFNNLDPSVKKFITTALALTLVFMSIAGVLTLLVGGVAAFVAAFAVAGSALFVVLGVMTLLTVGFTALVTAIVLAWNRSQGFREAVKGLGQELQRLWKDYIVPTGLAVRDAWNKHMRPALEKLVEVVNSKVMPVFREISAFLSSEFVNAFKEIGNNVKDFLVFAFEQLGKTIEKFVIPAIEFLTQFYREHESTIKMLVSWIVELGKWLLKIVAVFVLILATPIVGFIIGIVGAVVGLVTSIITVVEWLRTFVNWLKTEVPKGWAMFMGVITTGINFLRNLWSTFWNSDIMQLVRSVVGLLIALIQMLFSFWIKIFQINFKVFIGLWKIFWGAFTGVARAVWDALFIFFKQKWEMIIGIAKAIWARIRGAISTPVEMAKNDIVSIFDKIRSFFANAGSWLFEAGRNIVLGLIRGIRDKFNQATSVIQELTKKIRDFWPFSPAKVGPLSGTGSPFHAGQNIAKMLAEGMRSGMREINAATGGLSLAAIQNGTPYSPVSGRGGRTVDQTFNIYTNEINPRRHAAELGWALHGRM